MRNGIPHVVLSTALTDFVNGLLWAFGWRPALRESAVADALTLEPMMLNDAPRPAQAAIRTDLGAIFVSMELSRRAWLITSLNRPGFPGGSNS
jgi:hypothetical protein